MANLSVNFILTEKQSTCNIFLFEFCGQDLNFNSCFERKKRDRDQRKPQSSWCNGIAWIHRGLQTAHVNRLLYFHTIFRVVYSLLREPNQSYFTSLLKILAHRGGEWCTPMVEDLWAGFHPQLPSPGTSPQ